MLARKFGDPLGSIVAIVSVLPPTMFSHAHITDVGTAGLPLDILREIQAKDHQTANGGVEILGLHQIG